jgi:hypothetical protein
MADEHSEPRAEFPVAMLAGSLMLAVAVVVVLSIFVWGMGGH